MSGPRMPRDNRDKRDTVPIKTLELLHFDNQNRDKRDTVPILGAR
jgi:hypothetical protein